jgi:predicted P-loop ATPase
MPLTDPSGSRRFVCVNVENDIDFQTPVNYDQLYAQLKQEVAADRQPYWLTKDEERQLMLHNLTYQKLNGLGEMLLSIYQKPSDGEQGQWLSLKEISARLKQVFKGAYKEDDSSFEKIGRVLSRPDYPFEVRRKTSGREYWVKERE